MWRTTNFNHSLQVFLRDFLRTHQYGRSVTPGVPTWFCWVLISNPPRVASPLVHSSSPVNIFLGAPKIVSRHPRVKWQWPWWKWYIFQMNQLLGWYFSILSLHTLWKSQDKNEISIIHAMHIHTMLWFSCLGVAKAKFLFANHRTINQQ